MLSLIMVERDAKGKEKGEESHRASFRVAFLDGVVVVRVEEAKSDLAGLYTSQEDGLIYLFYGISNFQNGLTDSHTSIDHWTLVHHIVRLWRVILLLSEDG